MPTAGRFSLVAMSPRGIHWYGDHDGHGLNGCKAGVRKVFKAMGAWKRCPHNQIVMDGVREE